MANNFYRDQTSAQRDIIVNGGTTPLISTKLDSVRAYQWEIEFKGIVPTTLEAGIATTISKPITLGAKQVNGIGASVEDIEVHRVNDKVYYPGRPSMEELVITFDNLQNTKIDKLLYEYFAMTYDPRMGTLNNWSPGVVTSMNEQTKYEVQIKQLKHDGTIRNIIRLLGAYPKQLTHGEYNYATNDFSTLELKMRYDFFITTFDETGAVNVTTA